MMPSYSQKHFSSAHQRFLDAQISRFFKEHFPGIAGEELLKVIAAKLIELMQSFYPQASRLMPGQMLWVAVDKNTRADSHKVRYKPVILTVVNHDEVGVLEQAQQSLPALTSAAIARMCNEAYEQGALLSMRDIGLIFKRASAHISNMVSNYEKEHNVLLPTPSNLQDMGSGVTHKAIIIRKLLIEKKDMATVRNETQHSQQAIDRYLKDYRRVEMLLDEHKNIFYIAQITQLSTYLIKQYSCLYHEIKNHKPTP